MLEGFARLKRLRLEVVPVKAFSDRIPALLRGDGDVVAGLVGHAGPEEAGGPHHRGAADPALGRGSPGDAADQQPGGAPAEEGRCRPRDDRCREALAAGVPESQIEQFEDTEPMLRALADGRVEATVMTFSDFTFASERHPGLEAGAVLGEPTHAAWGVRKQDLKLKAELDAYLENLRGASWNRLVLTYFGEKALSVLGRK